MNEEQIRRLREGYYTAFINGARDSNLAYKPEFVSNDYQAGRKVLSSIEGELLHCQEFAISVAFVTLGGIEPLLQTLKELEERKIQGRILTTDYLNFSSPAALDKLHGLKNLEIRMYRADRDDGFHTKGYIFRDQDLYRIIVGSSNLTMTALTRNKEWNTRIISTEKGEYAEQILKEFHALWNSDRTQPYEDFIDQYRTVYEISRQQRQAAQETARRQQVYSYEMYTLRPNKMQTAFTASLASLRQAGKDRALLISATGTGKTYASAFAMRAEQQKRVLFLVHREQIARQALQSYQRVFGSTRTYGLLSGGAREWDADYLFSTIQTMSKDDVLQHFAPGTFQTIILDEVHRSGSRSYQKIMQYFHPQFWLGMTATPERTDGFDIYQLFDHNIAYEIRLQQAMEENLLCPFHYFGITDLVIDGETAGDDEGRSFQQQTPARREETGQGTSIPQRELRQGQSCKNLRQFNFLICDARVDYILEKAAYYGHSGRRVKGLMFVNRREVGEELSKKLNERGLRTRFLSGEDSQKERDYEIECLVTDDPQHEQLDYILTVDIFNEGVDIPEVNQVILLRPTESPIIFVQQLGRGLRKAADKEFVVILDFIGNYTNNYMIPIALSGDRSYNKDNMRRYVADGARVIPGSSSIHFDEIARKRIYASIDAANVNDLRLIRENYRQLKYKLGRIPSLMDFDRYGEMDVLHIIDKCGSYYNFLCKYDKDFHGGLTEKEGRVIEFVSSCLADGKRGGELQILAQALAGDRNLFHAAEHAAACYFNGGVLEKQNIVNVLTNEFPSGTGKKKYADCVLIRKNSEGDYDVSDAFARMLQRPVFRETLQELVDFGLYRNRRDYSRRYRGTNLVLYQKYTYEEVCRLLNWEHNEVPLNIGGYKYDAKTHTFPVFVNYEKDASVVATQQYEDAFTAPDRLTAISKSGRTLGSEDVQNFLHCEERGIAVHLFVRKNKDDKVSKEFYYLGQMVPEEERKPEEFLLPGTDKTAVRMYWRLDVPVREDLYEYLTEGER